MEFWKDWKFYLFIMQIMSMLFSACLFAIIKFNDFKHMSISFEKLEKILSELVKKVTNNSERISKVEGKIED